MPAGRLGFPDEVIRRDERVAIRVKSPKTEARTHFQRLEYFPPSERYQEHSACGAAW